MNKSRMLASVALVVLASAPAIAARAADNAIGDVVVTATKTGSTNLQKTAIAVSVVGGDVLDKSRVVTLRDLPSAVASLKISNAGVNVVPYIRGIGGFASNNEQDVGIYMDGVYLGRSSVALASNFNDLARVEVVKGPQGTVFGRNAVGGAINFISREPSKEFQFQNTLNFGNYNLIDEALRLSGAVTDRLQASLAIGYQKHDGYIQDVVPGISPAGAVNRVSIRGGLKYEVNASLTNLVRFDYMNTNEHFAPITTLVEATNDPRFVNSSGVYSGYESPLANAKVGNLRYFGQGGFPDTDGEIIYGVSDELNWTINDNISIKNLAAYRTSKTVYVQGGNGTEYLTGATRGTYNQHQFSEEIDVPHTFGNLKGVGGVFFWTEYEYQSADSISVYAPPVNNNLTGSDSYQDTRFPTQSYAVFLSESYHFTPDFAITLGGRYTQEHKVLDTYNTSFSWTGGLPLGWVGSNPANPGVRGAVTAPTVKCNTSTLVPAPTAPLCTGAGINYYQSQYFPFVAGYGNNFPLTPPNIVPQLSQNNSAFTPKIGLEWQATKDAFVYFNVTRGFKSGGYNFTARSPLGLTFQPEYITSYEAGAKTDWFDKRLRLNVAVFRNDWSNLQVNQSISIPGSTTPFQQSSNAASARITGLDADLTAKPWDGWTFTSSVTWLPDAVYVNYTTGQVTGNFLKNLIISRNDPRENSAANTYNANGHRLQNAPEVSAIITGQRDFDLGNGNSLFVRGEAAYTGNTYFDISNDPISRRNPFAVFNASIGWVSTGGHYQVELWGRNIGDKQYFYSINPGTTMEGVVGAPRTFGVQLNYTY